MDEKLGPFTFRDGVAYVRDRSDDVKRRLERGPISTPFLEALKRKGEAKS